MEKITVGVIGVGAMGAHHVRNLAVIKHVYLSAIADVNSSRGQQIASRYRCAFYRDYRQLLADKNISAVTIAVPTYLHFPVARNTLLAGKHVLVEKPITHNSRFARRLISLAHKKGLILGVGHLERFNPAVLALKKYLDKGEIGRVVSIFAKRVGLYPPNASGTNVIIDLAIHDIDIFSFLLGIKPTRVYCAGKNDYAQILMTLKGDVNAMLEVNWITPVKIRHLSVTGTKGYIEMDYLNQKLKIYRTPPSRGFTTFPEFLNKFARLKIQDVKITGNEPLKAELEVFIDCIRNKKAYPVDGRVGLSALLIAEKALKCLK